MPAILRIDVDKPFLMLRDLGKMSCGFGGKVYGFTKHGSGKFKLTRRHDPNYDREKFIEYARQLNLR